MRASPVEESPHPSEARANTETPTRNARPFPMRSPMRPPTAISEASVSRYAFTTHAWPDSPRPRSSAISGSATPTTVVSIMIIASDPVIATRISRRRDGVIMSR